MQSSEWLNKCYSKFIMHAHFEMLLVMAGSTMRAEILFQSEKGESDTSCVCLKEPYSAKQQFQLIHCQKPKSKMQAKHSHKRPKIQQFQRQRHRHTHKNTCTCTGKKYGRQRRRGTNRLCKSQRENRDNKTELANANKSYVTLECIPYTHIVTHTISRHWRLNARYRKRRG